MYVNISEILPGMRLEKPVHHPINKKMLLNHGTILKDVMIKKLVDIGISGLYIADRFTLSLNPIEQMADNLKDIYVHLIRKYASENTEGNLNDNIVNIAQNVIKTVDKICRAEDILDFCLQMKILKDSRLFDHALLTSVFSGLLAGSLGLTDEIYNVMVGGLLHDIGCTEMPFLIGIKSMKPQEELLWKEHPVYGYYFSIQHNIPRHISEIILHHHECWNGTGYPKHLKGSEIPLGSRILCVCSTVSDHIIFQNMQPYESMEYLYCSSNMFFDKEIVDAFVNNITLYPLKALVRLTTGEVGIVSNVRKNNGPRPIINVYYNRFNKPLSEPRTIDLGEERTIFISEILG